MYMHSGPETRLDIFPSVIDVEDLFGSDASFADGSPVDDGKIGRASCRERV